MKKIGFNEKFIVYVYVDYKLAAELLQSLNDAGFKAKTYRHADQKNDDEELRVTVTPETSDKAWKIINSVIR